MFLNISGSLANKSSSLSFFTLGEQSLIQFRFPSEIDTYINQWDEQIFLGEGYFEGGKADFENHQSPYIISDHIDDFTSQYKKKAKERHCSRVKKLEFEAFIDHINISIILV